MADKQKIIVENIRSPGHRQNLDASKYNAMKDAMLATIPSSTPGLSAKEIKEAVLPLLSQELWPGGAKAGWWMKAVQLDMEAKGILLRDEKAKPLRWFLAPERVKDR